jgi:hypothetical protein
VQNFRCLFFSRELNFRHGSGQLSLDEDIRPASDEEFERSSAGGVATFVVKSLQLIKKSNPVGLRAFIKTIKNIEKQARLSSINHLH